MVMQSVESYLAMRRAGGYALKGQEATLRSFARYAAACGDSHVRASTAVAWAAQAPSPARRAVRLKAVVRLARYARTEDQAHEVPPADIFGSHRHRPPPYIFSSTAFARLIEQARRLGPQGSLWPRTFSTLLGLLWCTGLRISEAMALRSEDVTADGLVIHRSKFNKSRLVPLHDTAAAQLGRYLACRRRVGGATDRLFVSQRGRPLEYTGLRKTFRRVVRAAGLEQPGGPVPRLHSLRHSFAVRVLLACPDGRDRIASHTLALSTYLGHAHVADTYWYFEATPELMADIAGRCERFMAGGAS